jgi:thioredoxin reductase
MYALLLTSLSGDVVLLTDGSELDPGDASLIRSARVVVRRDPVARLEGAHGGLARVVFADGSADERVGLFLMPKIVRSALAVDLGCELDESGAIVTDEDGRTSVPRRVRRGRRGGREEGRRDRGRRWSRAAYAINAGLARSAPTALSRGRV